MPLPLKPIAIANTIPQLVGRVQEIIDVLNNPPVVVTNTGYYEPLTNGEPLTPELIFANGDVISVWKP